MMFENSYKQANNFLRMKMLCLVENETKVLKTGGTNLVKNALTSVSAFISYYFKDSSLFSVKSFRNQCKTRKLHKKNLLTLVHSVTICLTILATNPYFL